MHLPYYIPIALLMVWIAVNRQEFTAVYAVSRHPLDYDVKRAKHIRLDLSDKEAIKQVGTSMQLLLCWMHVHLQATIHLLNEFAGPAGVEG